MTYSSSTLIQITQLGFVNAWLVREDDGFTLVDALALKSPKAILAAAERAGAPIRRILLTHAHPDHVGAVDALVAALPDAEFIVPEREAKVLDAKPVAEPGEPEGKLPSKSVGVKSLPTRVINDGDMVGSLRAVAAPGHSVGQLAYLDTRDQTLLCGDAYSTMGKVATTAKPYWRMPLPAMASWHKPTALESAKRLRALSPARLAAGHGRLVESPGADMDRAIGWAS